MSRTPSIKSHYKNNCVFWNINNNGKFILHREDGPAVIRSNGDKFWYINDQFLTFSEYKEWFIKKISDPSYELTNMDVKFIKEYLE